MTNYPLIEKWLPKLHIDPYGWISPRNLELELMNSKKVTSFGDAASWMTQEAHQNFARGERLPIEALLIGIQPIKQETAEDLLREFVEKMNAIFDDRDRLKILTKARAFLEKSK